MEILFYILAALMISNHAYNAGKCAENKNACHRKVKELKCRTDKVNKCTRLGKKND